MSDVRSGAMGERVAMKTRRVFLHPVNHRHLRFLLRLWNDPEVMRYAGSAKDWDEVQMRRWYDGYRERVAKRGNTERHFIHRLRNGTLVGESGLGALPRGWSCRNYEAPRGRLALMTDVKLAPAFWNRGYGTEAMKAVVEYVFRETRADLLVVPPDRRNVPAIRVYEKAGFSKTAGVWYGSHLIYVMTREDFERRARGRHAKGGAIG